MAATAVTSVLITCDANLDFPPLFPRAMMITTMMCVFTVTTIQCRQQEQQHVHGAYFKVHSCNFTSTTAGQLDNGAAGDGSSRQVDALGLDSVHWWRIK